MSEQELDELVARVDGVLNVLQGVAYGDLLFRAPNAAPGKELAFSDLRALLSSVTALREREKAWNRQAKVMAQAADNEKKRAESAERRLADAEREGLRKDARRYRWLRAGPNQARANEIFSRCCEDHLDGELDAAIEEGRKG